MIELAVVFLLLHSPDGSVVEVNPDQITSIRGRHEVGVDHFTKEAHCLINLTDGKYVTVRETCDEVRKMMKGDLI